jgi:hypothetical protein
METDPLSVANSTDKPAPLGKFFDRLPEWVIDTLTPEQKEAIHLAAEEPA